MVKRNSKLALPVYDDRVFARVVKKDERDDKFKISRGLLRGEKINPTIKEKMWRRGPVLDQGDLPACVGFSVSNVLAASPIRQFVNPVGIYEIAKRFDEYKGEDYEGTSVRAGLDVGRMLGVFSEYRWGKSISAICTGMLHIGSGIFGVMWTEDMMHPDSRGFIKASGPVIGGHAIHSFHVNTVDRYFTWNNSWGKAWGDNGMCRIRFSEVEKLLTNDGEFGLPIESDPTNFFK